MSIGHSEASLWTGQLRVVPLGCRAGLASCYLIMTMLNNLRVSLPYSIFWPAAGAATVCAAALCSICFHKVSGPSPLHKTMTRACSLVTSNPVSWSAVQISERVVSSVSSQQTRLQGWKPVVCSFSRCSVTWVVNDESDFQPLCGYQKLSPGGTTWLCLC